MLTLITVYILYKVLGKFVSCDPFEDFFDD